MLRTLLILSIVFAAISIALVNPFGALLAYQWFAYFRPQEWVWTETMPAQPEIEAYLNFVADPGEKKVYFEVSDYATYVLFENPR